SRMGAQPPEQMLRLLVGWVYDGLQEAERGLLRRLSLFAAPFTVRAAAAVSGAADSFPSGVSERPVTQTEARVEEQLSRLAGRGLLLGPPPGAGAIEVRYGLPSAVREHVRARLLEASGALAVARRHGQYWLAVAEQAMGRLG